MILDTSLKFLTNFKRGGVGGLDDATHTEREPESQRPRQRESSK